MAWGIAAALAVAMVGEVALWGLGLLRDDYHSFVPESHAVDYDPEFTRDARAALPTIAALNHYYSKHSAFPANAAQLAHCFPPGSVTARAPYLITVRGWHYSPDRGGKGYGIWSKIAWDASFGYEYDGSKGHWIFSSDDLPDGPGSKELILKP